MIFRQVLDGRIMKLTSPEIKYLTALVREQNQAGCKRPAHDLLRKYAYPNAPLSGPGSLVIAYEVVPLTSMLLRDFRTLEEIDSFLRKEETITDPEWPWSSAKEFRARLEEARREQAGQQLSSV
jgi:hypothetical protein